MTLENLTEKDREFVKKRKALHCCQEGPEAIREHKYLAIITSLDRQLTEAKERPITIDEFQKKYLPDYDEKEGMQEVIKGNPNER